MNRSGSTRIKDDQKKKVTVVNESGLAVSQLSYETIFDKTAEALKNKELEPITLIFHSSDSVRQLNKKYRGQDKPTNVLSFEDSREIILAPEVIAHEAQDYGLTPEQWTARLVVHGILHLEGDTHNTKQGREKMEKLEESILEKLGYL